jgi:chromosome segregation protein
VRLKRLELSGFKTFPERTALQFAAQITGIVGPNGSGKSNIFDAIRWALGEGSLRTLRGIRTEDIIFAGTERRRPLAMAEVTVTLDNEDGTLVLPPAPGDEDAPPTPLAFAEVTVTRRAMRSAESQYFINGLPCRLRDIQTMFLGTGLGGHSYSLITQGEVEQMLDATPEERRMILEEAAGLAKYKRRRRDAERRMAAAETTLLRVTDILGELDAQTAQLAAQAEAAERYQAQTRELRALELSLQVEEIRRGIRAQRRVREQLEDIAARRQEIDAVARTLMDQRATLDRRAVEAGREWEAIQQGRVSLVERRAAAEAAVELVSERLRGVEAQRQRTEREAGRYRDERDALRTEEAGLVETGRDLAAREARAQAEVEAVEARLHTMDAEATRNEQELEADRTTVRALVEERGKYQNEIAAAEAREAGHRDRSAGLHQQITGLSERLDGARTQREALADESARGTSDLEGLRGRLVSLGTEHEERVGTREALVADERHLEIERERRASRLRFLEEAHSQFRGYDSGAREILLAWRANPDRLPGVRGTLADYLSVPREWRAAIESSLGSSLSAVIVSSVDDARRALALLGGEPRGSVTFVPVSSVVVPDPPAVPPAVAADPATLGRAVDRVTVSGAHPEAISALLADVLIVADLDAAVRAQATGYRGRIATLAGEVLGPEGVLVAGRPLPEQGGILGRTEEMAEMRAALDGVERAVSDVGHRRGAIAEQIRSLAGAITAIEADVARRSEALAEGRRRLTLVEAEAERLAGEIARLAGEKTAADQGAAAQRSLQERLQQEAGILSTRLAEAEERIAQVTAGLRDYVEARRAAASRITELRVMVTEVGARRQALGARMAEIEKGIAHTVARADELAGELRQLQTDTDRLEAEREVERARCEAIDAERARLASDQAALEEERAGLAARQAEAEAQHRQALDRTAALAEEGHKAEVREAQIEAEMGSARRRIEEEFGIPFDRAVGSVPDSVHREETLGRIEALRGLIAVMGPVNLLAIEEHRQVAERALALRAQMEDVQGTIAALRTLIVQLEEVIRGQFDKTYEAVDKEFADLFVSLFGGGRAGLERVPGLDGGEPGIDIIAQPPGKKLRSLGALSGGERVMVALAFVFAMLRVRPSPFCVFDEVEAALDEANTRKIGDVLRELSARTQIIIITHNKATMEASDALFGVTMEEGGVSQMVSMRLVDPESAGEPQPVG